MIHPSTFSIVAHSDSDQAWGIAVASKFPAAGAVVPWARAGAGAVATQSHANTAYGPEGLALMADGLSAQQTLDKLIEADADRALRQVGLVDAGGGSATFTGEKCLAWAGGRIGQGYAVQGNILTGPEVVPAMAEAYESAGGTLADRLLAALLAGDRAGGDRRGRQSAGLLVVKEAAGYGGHNDRWLDYRVDDHPDPVPRLTELLELHDLYFGQSPPEDRVALQGVELQALKRILADQGYYQGAVDASLDEPTRRALFAFLGNENFEDRSDVEAGWIDRPVLEFIQRKFG